MTQSINPYNDYLVFSTSQVHDNYTSLLEDKFANVSYLRTTYMLMLTIIELLPFANSIPSKRRVRLDEYRVLPRQLLRA